MCALGTVLVRMERLSSRDGYERLWRESLPLHSWAWGHDWSSVTQYSPWSDKSIPTPPRSQRDLVGPRRCSAGKGSGELETILKPLIPTIMHRTIRACWYHDQQQHSGWRGDRTEMLSSVMKHQMKSSELLPRSGERERGRERDKPEAGLQHSLGLRSGREEVLKTDTAAATRSTCISVSIWVWILANWLLHGSSIRPILHHYSLSRRVSIKPLKPRVRPDISPLGLQAGIPDESRCRCSSDSRYQQGPL
ncbi:uncharacterized protein LOC114768048 [Denticeps clupeoides]|uniref:uncharacterized protein LOC114768048 n=1 Tax=Denticeps clupeoides TaxID=299321 RepID=UPI0010A42BA1|nr:uncharacterized protein LOC114768048 [Denticeps clupeoides]